MSSWGIATVIALGTTSVMAATADAGTSSALSGMTIDQKKSFGTDTVAIASSTMTKLFEKLTEAQNSKDVVKINCVNQKVSVAKALQTVVVNSNSELQTAMANKNNIDHDKADHQLRKLEVARSKFQTMLLYAEECIGQLAFSAEQNMKIFVWVPEDLPKGDPSSLKPLPAIVVSNPPASPATPL